MISFTKDQKYIVTGASSGIGEGIALLLNELGATVIAMGRNEERLRALKLKAHDPEAMFLEAKDLAQDIGALPTYVKELRGKYGKFSGMVYSAGVGFIQPLQLIDYAKSRELFDINYFAPIMMTKGLLDRRNNIGKGASFVYISSIDAIASTKGQAIYAGSKAALAATVKSLSREVAPYGVRLNCLMPSIIKSPMSSSAVSKAMGIEEVFNDQYPMGWGRVEDVANFAAFLLSDKARYLSGQKYIVDAGGVI